MVGAPQIDDMVNCPLPSNKEIVSNIGISPDDAFILSVLHPVTENLDVISKKHNNTLMHFQLLIQR